MVSITTQKAQTLCLDLQGRHALKGKKVAVVDDVISTGESLQVIERLVEKGGRRVAARAPSSRGDARRSDIIFSEELLCSPSGLAKGGGQRPACFCSQRRRRKALEDKQKRRYLNRCPFRRPQAVPTILSSPVMVLYNLVISIL